LAGDQPGRGHRAPESSSSLGHVSSKTVCGRDALPSHESLKTGAVVPWELEFDKELYVAIVPPAEGCFRNVGRPSKHAGTNPIVFCVQFPTETDAALGARVHKIPDLKVADTRGDFFRPPPSNEQKRLGAFQRTKEAFERCDLHERRDEYDVACMGSK
jgi:hypothetical protein